MRTYGTVSSDYPATTDLAVLRGLTNITEPVKYETWWAKLFRRFGMLRILQGSEQKLATMLERGFMTDREEMILSAMVHQRLDKPWMAATGRNHAIDLKTAVRWTVFAMAHPEYSHTRLAPLAGVSRPTFTGIVDRLRPVLVTIADEVGSLAVAGSEHCSDSRSRYRYVP